MLHMCAISKECPSIEEIVCILDKVRTDGIRDFQILARQYWASSAHMVTGELEGEFV